jgi:hypothetical protein
LSGLGKDITEKYEQKTNYQRKDLLCELFQGAEKYFPSAGVSRILFVRGAEIIFEHISEEQRDLIVTLHMCSFTELEHIYLLSQATSPNATGGTQLSINKITYKLGRWLI